MTAKLQSPRSHVVLVGGGLFAALALAWCFWNLSPPQLGDNEQAFSAVDALFTAVTARNEKLLAECEARLKSLRDDGALAEKASTHLNGIILQAKTGEWRQASRKLYKFMQAQRREAL